MRNFILLFILFFAIGNPISAQDKITLQDLQVERTFVAKTIEGLRSTNDGLYYTTIEENSQIVKYSYKTGEKTSVVFELSQVEDAPIETFSSYVFSDDETKILLITDIERIYRRSYTAEYYIWNTITEELTELSAKGRQQLATFSPNGERVAFVRDNNLFIKSLKFWHRKSGYIRW